MNGQVIVDYCVLEVGLAHITQLGGNYPVYVVRIPTMLHVLDNRALVMIRIMTMVIEQKQKPDPLKCAIMTWPSIRDPVSEQLFWLSLVNSKKQHYHSEFLMIWIIALFPTRTFFSRHICIPKLFLDVVVVVVVECLDEQVGCSPRSPSPSSSSSLLSASFQIDVRSSCLWCSPLIISSSP